MSALRRLLGPGLAILALSVAAPASATSVKEFPVESKLVSSLAQAPDGTIFYSGTHPYGSSLEPKPDFGFVGQVGPGGPLGEIAVPPAEPGEIAVGAESDAWLGRNDEGIARLSGASWSLVVTQQRPGPSTNIAPAAGGGIWFDDDEPAVNAVGRITADGEVTQWPLPAGNAAPGALVEGREGDVWFVEWPKHKIGRMTSSGEFAEYPLPKSERPIEIAVDGAGDIWFGGIDSSFIGRIDPAGKIVVFHLPDDVTTGPIAAGTDGRIWFTEVVQPQGRRGRRDLGRIGPTGRYSEVRLPKAAVDPVDLVAGAEGDIWFAARGEPPCEGGGSSCLAWVATKPAIIGRVAVDPLTTTIVGDEAAVWRNRANVPIACGEGHATDICRGTVELKIGGRTVGRDRYTVPVDYTRQWPAKRLAGAPSLSKLAGKGRRAQAILRPDTGGQMRRTVSLSPVR